jgi:hypothetical protein
MRRKRSFQVPSPLAQKKNYEMKRKRDDDGGGPLDMGCEVKFPFYIFMLSENFPPSFNFFLPFAWKTTFYSFPRDFDHPVVCVRGDDFSEDEDFHFHEEKKRKKVVKIFVGVKAHFRGIMIKIKFYFKSFRVKLKLGSGYINLQCI